MSKESGTTPVNIFKTRFSSGVILVLVFYFLCLYSSDIIWFFSAGLVFAVCGYEYGGIFRFSRRVKILLAAFFPVGALIFLGARLQGYFIIKEIWIYALSAFAILFWCVIVPLIIRYSWRGTHWLNGFIQILCSLLPCLSVLLLYESSRVIILFTFLMVAIFDSCSYLVGRFIGSRALAFSVSPGKTIEGLAGGAVAVTVAYFVVLEHAYLDGPPISAMGLCLFSVFFSFVCLIGDLYESFLKRTAGIKDSGSLIPGHGGVLDRLDASFAVIPIFVPIFYFVHH